MSAPLPIGPLLGLAALALVEVDLAPLLGGALVHAGRLPWAGALAAAAVGAWLSDQAWYLAGRYARRALRRWRRWRRLRPQLARWQARWGWWQLPLCRLLLGTRVATMALVGALRRPWPAFALWDALTNVAFASLLLALGAMAHARLGPLGSALRRADLAILFVAALLALGALARARRRAAPRTTRGPTPGGAGPRARASTTRPQLPC